MLKKLCKNLYLRYTVLFGLCAGILYMPFYTIRRSLIGTDDSFNQEFPLFIYIGRYIRRLLKGTVRQFDFRIGLGDDVIAALNWHGFGDVFQTAGALFHTSHMEYAYALVMVLKFFCCGIVFLIFSRRYLHRDYARLSGALIYAFSIYGIQKGLDFWVFLNPMITFPLIICGIDDIRENKSRISWPLITGLVIQALSGFYFLYMEVIMAVGYFLIVQLADEEGSFKERFTKLWKDGLAVLVQAVPGVGLGAVILLPAVIGYLTSSRTGKGFTAARILEWFFYDKEYYLTFVKSLVVPEIWESIVTVPLLILLGLLAVFTTKKLCRSFKWVIGIFLIGFGMPFVGSMMNGFSYCTDRWYFGILLFLIITAMIGMERVEKLGKVQIFSFCLLSAALILYNVYRNGISSGILLRGGCLLICTGMLPLIWNCKKRNVLLWMTAAALVVLNGIFALGHSRIGGCGYAWNFRPMNSVIAQMQDAVSGIERKDRFERYDIYSSSLANSMVMDYNGTTEYFSTLNGNVSEFYRTLNIAPGVRSATWILKGLDGRPELLSLLSVAQYTDFHMEQDQAIVQVKENENFLPLGFTYTDWISRESFEALSVPEMQSTILKAVVLDEEPDEGTECIPDIWGENEKLNCSVEYMDITQDGASFTTAEGSRIRIWVNDVQDVQSVYVKLEGFTTQDEGTHECYVGNKNLQIRDLNDDYYMGYDDFWVYVTELQEKNGCSYFDISFQNENTYCLRDIQVYRHEVDTASIKKRGEHILGDIQIGTNEISGSIEMNRREWLFLSVPYSSGWKAYIDGEETQIRKANIGFMAVSVPEGEHEIRFVYTTPGLRTGIMISMISLSVLAVFVVLEQKRKRT